MSNFFSQFNNKRVAIVGSAPHLRGERYGSQIDDHDEIIRINSHPANNPDTGYRTTLRFIGATFNLQKWNELDSHWFPCGHWIQDRILTTKKNVAILKAMGKEAQYYDANVPMRCLNALPSFTRIEKQSLIDFKKPPTSGTVVLILLVSNCSPAMIDVFGFSSLSNTDANMLETYSNGSISKYNAVERDACHMPIQQELWIRRELLKAQKPLLKFH